MISPIHHVKSSTALNFMVSQIQHASISCTVSRMISSHGSGHSLFAVSPVNYIISRLVQMPLNTTAAPMVMHTTYEFSELLLQAGVPDDLDAENVSTAGFVESIYALRLPLFF